MRSLALVVVLMGVPVITSSDSVSTYNAALPPTSGSDLLEACQAVVRGIDGPSFIKSLDAPELIKLTGRLSWCSGYLDSVQYVNIREHFQLAAIAALNVTVNGDEKQKQAVFEILRGACIPSDASTGQLARVVVKYLQDHPEKLHGTLGPLVDEAMMKAFPCGTSLSLLYPGGTIRDYGP